MEISTYNLRELINSAIVIRNPLDAVDALVSWLVDHQKRAGQTHAINAEADYPAFGQLQSEDLGFVLDIAKGLEYIQTLPAGVRLHAKGWQRAADIQHTRKLSNQAFVAMWFDPRLEDAWTNGIAPALRDTGYTPLRIDLTEHNEKIDDRIMTEIRRSGLLVADFTGHRGGVYFEAGFAMGLAIPIIRTCRKDDIDGLHFDTRQYSHVVWETAEDLHKKLRLRIAATIPGRAERLPAPRE